jgi:hypothetical protein
MDGNDHDWNGAVADLGGDGNWVKLLGGPSDRLRKHGLESSEEYDDDSDGGGIGDEFPVAHVDAGPGGSSVIVLSGVRDDVYTEVSQAKHSSHCFEAHVSSNAARS